MRRGRSVALRRILYVAMLSLSVAAYILPALAAEGDEQYLSRPCDASSADRVCSLNQRCVENKINDRVVSQCECVYGYEMIQGDCVPSASTKPAPVTTIKPYRIEESGGGSVAAGLLIPTFLIIIGVVLYFGARRYRWVQRFRQYRQNRYGNVLVTRDDDDDDDSPIA